MIENDAILLPLIGVFVVLWVLVWVADKLHELYERRAAAARAQAVWEKEADEEMECPRCKKISFARTGAFWHIKTQTEIDEYECTACGLYATF